jgi:hypothetical protein
MLIIVVIKFIAPNIDDIPAKCKLNIPRSTAPPEWYSMLDNGGYTVHPVPTPPSTKLDATSNVNAGGNNQKLMLFNLGNAISGAPIINGTIQFGFSLSFNKDRTISSSFRHKDALRVVSEDHINLSDFR